MIMQEIIEKNFIKFTKNDNASKPQGSASFRTSRLCRGVQKALIQDNKRLYPHTDMFSVVVVTTFCKKCYDFRS